jgi:perosamine synthetase
VAERIALFRPVVHEDAVAAAAEVLRSGWPGPGPMVERFEHEFAAYVGAPHAVAVSSGTAALHLALILLGLEPGDEVISSPITFVGANEVILHQRGTVVFADVHPHTGNLDVASVADHLGPRTRAVMATHLGGTPVDLAELYELADRAGVAVIEDAAHACGSTYRGVRIGGHAGMQAFSFQSTKNLTTVDGGMLCLGSADHAARARRLRWMGINQDTWSRDRHRSYRWAYRVDELGHKYAMNDLNASIGLAHLAHLEADNDRRRAIAARYREGLRAVAGVEVIEPTDDRTSATYISPVLVDGRDDVVEQLALLGIGSGVHFQRNDCHSVFGGLRDLPGAEAYWTRTLTLPMHLELTDADVDRVIDALDAVVGRRG